MRTRKLDMAATRHGKEKQACGEKKEPTRHMRGEMETRKGMSSPFRVSTSPSVCPYATSTGRPAPPGVQL